MSEEEWRPVVGWEGRYEVSSLGRVRNARTEHVLAGYTNPIGRHFTTLYRKGVGRVRYATARIVCQSFNGPPVGDATWALHRDGDPSNDTPGNLYWGTPLENVQDMMRHGRHALQSKAECPSGHPYTEENTYLSKAGGRSCKECHRTAVRETARSGLPDGDHRHGTWRGYAGYGCRCDMCRRAGREYRA